MKIFHLFLGLLFLLTTHRTYSQKTEMDCRVLKNGKFKYVDGPDSTAYIVIKDNAHTEFYANGKYYIKSIISSVNDCEYIMTMTEITLPNFPYAPGDSMSVQVTKIEDGIIYYNSTVKGEHWKGKMKILNE